MAKKTRKPISEDAKPIIIFLILLVVIIVVFSLWHKQFLSARNISNLLKHAAINSMFALGALFVVVVGHFDLSFHMVCSLAGMTTSYLIAEDIHVLPSIFAGLFVGAVFGLVNGVAVGRLRLPDMVTTIATGAIAWGFAWIYSDGAYIWKNAMTSGILLINDAKLFHIPLPVILMLTLYFLSYLILHRSRYGRCFYSTGENRVAAIFSGVNVTAYIIAAFTICAVLASLGAIMGNASQGSGSVRVGMVFLLPAYATIFLGSAVFKKPTLHGTFFAAIFISVMLNGFTLLAVPYYYSDFIIGIVLLIALSLSSDMVLKKRAGKSIANVSESSKEVAL
jgi:ribose transport system permease protein